MRYMMLAVIAVLTMPVAAQAQVCATGDVARIRASKITPTGSMAGFQQAVADHLAWYKSHGFKLDQVVAPVLVYDSTGKESSSKDEVVTIATGDNVPRDKRDAGWDGFVAKYRANSTILSEKVVCLPKK